MSKLAGSVDEMCNFAAEVAGKLRLQKVSAAVLTLTGDLGSGKTTFVQGVARYFGVEDRVTSPTFVIEKVYELPRGPFKHLIHIDAYRLESAHELEVLGWHEMAAEPTNLILVEWPERVPGIFSKGAMRLLFTFIDENTRKVELKKK